MKGFLVGYCHERDGYRVWVPEKQDVVWSRDIVFNDEQLLQEKVEISTALEKPEEEENNHLDSENNTGKAQRHNLRDKSQIKKPARYMASAIFVDSRNPNSFQEAIASDDAKHCHP